MKNGLCWGHGGVSINGALVTEHHRGRHKEYLPDESLIGRYQTALNNRDLLSLQDDIALIDVRMAELVERIGTPDGKAHWQAIQAISLSIFDLLNVKQITAEQVVEARKMAAQLVDLTNGVLMHEETWLDIRDTQEHKRKLAETEHNRLVKAKQMMTVSDGMGIIAALVDSIKRNVKDRQALTALSEDITRIVTAPISR